MNSKNSGSYPKILRCEVVQMKFEILAVDTGGTMTDTFLIDSGGNFLIGKAQTTPDREYEGILRSLKDALKNSARVEETLKQLKAFVYTGTIMINRIVERKGLSPIGVITTAGFEDTLRFGRGKQSWVELPYSERLHAVSHHYPDPIIGREYIVGVRERVLPTGYEMIPLYEDEARKAVEYLIEKGVKVIAVCLLFSFANPEHELLVEKIAREIMKEKSKDIPVFLSHRINPVLGELGRMNTTILQIYAAEPSRDQFRIMDQEFRKRGMKAPLRILTSYGTTVSPEHEKLITTVTSGPTGGLLGCKYLGDFYGFDYIAGTDIGGTSFDVGLITAGQYYLKMESTISRFIVNIPMIALDSIGAGTGSYIRLDPVTKRVRIGPDSTSYRVGVSWEEGGVETVTINDSLLLLGYLNPDYFLGGEIKLSKKRAEEYFEEQVSRKLGVDIYDAAEGCLELVNLEMRMYLNAMIVGTGHAPENYHLVSYGGGGPILTAGYTSGLKFQGILVPTWAAAFSAFGAATAEYGIRHDLSTELLIAPDGSTNELVALMLNQGWEELRKMIEEELKNEGIDPEKVLLKPAVRMMYFGMLDDLEVPVLKFPIEAEDVKAIIDSYEDMFEKIYAVGAKSPEAGYLITRIILSCVYPTPKPKLPDEEKSSKEPPEKAYKKEREIYWNGRWYDANVLEMDELKAGNVIHGPSIVEAPSTTFTVPPAYTAYLDRHRVFWLIPPNGDFSKISERW
jgi:N-methylhydantoinase A/acetone carboxylase beta subunit